ncbi:NTP transferase domain-containing protein [Ancylobacter lacus]|uniref:NTP transferase domain-containing protein n=1 Tax=Ancylobacter lacus TaxID=2579970 RepID=UPI001BD0660E|nr:molybdopterin-binding/glycosyltransferase family 2 protein [Ancylobacter lacus]
MKFGTLPLAEAEGALSVHSIRLPGLELRKGTRLDRALLEALARAGVERLVAARLEPGDIAENDAAASLAAALAGAGTTADAAFTGRVNLRATVPGVLVVDPAAVDVLNAVDESVTLATLPNFRAVAAGEMVATVKIIPFAVEGAVHRAALARARPMVRVAPYRLRRAAVISTLLPGLLPKVVAKTLRVTAQRLAPAGAAIVWRAEIPHEAEAVERAVREAIAAGAEIVILFGASAIADRRDVVPAGIVAAGGQIEHFGMPVDPGNLLLVARCGAVPVLGAPGCARSSRENGFDWVLHRLLAGLPVRRADLAGMGVGGLLMEIATRPQPREGLEEPAIARTAAVVLAAGRGTRMPGRNKLAAPLDGVPLVRRAVEAALASRARPVLVVTGHEPERVREALAGLDVSFVHNPDHAEGMSTSLRAGIAAVPAEADAAVVLLGDMPRVTGGLIDRLVEALAPAAGRLVAVPVRQGRRGNPVAWARRLFPELAALTGDVGARHLIAAHAEAVADVAVEDDDAFVDVDTSDALELEELHRIAARAGTDGAEALEAMRAEDA